jgi:hypothetical protein
MLVLLSWYVRKNTFCDIYTDFSFLAKVGICKQILLKLPSIKFTNLNLAAQDFFMTWQIQDENASNRHIF